MQSPPIQYRAVAVIVGLSGAMALWIATGVPARSQDTPAPPGRRAAQTSTARKSAPSKSPNVKSGEITALDTTGDTLTLRDRTGKPSIYVLTDKTHFTRNRRAAQRTDFKVGDAVVLHFRKSRTDGALLVTELDDAVSWMWLSEMRKSTTPAVVTSIVDNTLSVTVGQEHLPFDYTISDKTRWEKAGKEVDAAAFKSGDMIYVVPRSLPSGSIMARAVADSAAGAAQGKERLAASVHGAVVSVDLPGHRVVVKTFAGDMRNFAINDETEVIVNSKPMPLGTLRQGLHVVVRIRHDVGGEEIAWRFTVEGSKRYSPVRKRMPSGKGVVKGP